MFFQSTGLIPDAPQINPVMHGRRHQPVVLQVQRAALEVRGTQAPGVEINRPAAYIVHACGTWFPFFDRELQVFLASPLIDPGNKGQGDPLSVFFNLCLLLTETKSNSRQFTRLVFDSQLQMIILGSHPPGMLNRHFCRK